MNKPKIITLSGMAESGKSTTAKMLKSKLEEKDNKVIILANADLLKDICKTQYNWNGIKDEMGRNLLQEVGSKIREKDEDFFVDFLIKIVNTLPFKIDYVIVEDCRYENEIDKWKNDFDVFSIYIKRPYHINKLTMGQKDHISESNKIEECCNFIFSVYNQSELYKQVENFMNLFNIIESSKLLKEEKIALPRGGGKTTALICKAIIENKVLVVESNKSIANILANFSSNGKNSLIKIDILTYHQYLRYVIGHGPDSRIMQKICTNGVLIDEIHHFLGKLKIAGFSETIPNENKSK